MSPKASLKSAEHTPINYSSRKNSFDTDFTDLVAATEIIDATEMGQLTSHLFSQEREVGADPFSVFGSQAHSCVAKPLQGTDLSTSSGQLVRDTDLCPTTGKLVRGVSHFQTSKGHCLKVHEIENWRVCNFLKWKWKKILSEQKAFMNTLKRKLIELFKENMQLRQDYVKRRLNWTEENGTGEMLILLFLELADILNPRE